jgi:hypothetical protein
MRRNGLTLIEMVVALVSSSVLVAGLAGALYVSTQALPPVENPIQKNTTASKVLCDLMSDASTALSFSERTARAITFTVPDRNGDSLAETIRYAWSGTAGDPLTYQYNGGTAVNVAEDVHAFALTALTRDLLAEGTTATAPNEVVMDEFVATKPPTTSNVTSLAVTKPTGTIGGNLLIACVSLDGNAYSSLTAPSGWTLIQKGPQGVSPIAQTFGVWYKIATASEPSTYTFTWTPTEQAYAWIMRFSGHDATNPINASTAQSGSATSTAISPAVTTSVPNAMILRLHASDGMALPVQATSLLLHTYITNDRSLGTTSVACTGTAAYILQPTVGDSGTASLLRSVTAPEEYTSVTIAIAPAPID